MSQRLLFELLLHGKQLGQLVLQSGELVSQPVDLG